MTTRRIFLASVSASAGASLLPRRAMAQTGAAQQPATNNDPLAEALNLNDFESLAQQRISRMAYEFVASGAGDEITLRWNREALEKIALWPRVLNDVSKLDTHVTLFGNELAFPILLAPTAFHRAVHPEGEAATARGAGAAGAAFVVSTATNTRIEEIARAATQPLWFQMYVQRDREFTKALVQQVEAAGVRALCVTVDQPVSGPRNRQQRVNFKLPPGVETPYLNDINTGQRRLLSGNHDNVTWKDIEWLRSIARVPGLLKGILHPDDAETAIRAGVAGIMVSNHGARNLDTGVATIDALPLVADKVAGRVPVLMDGGIRRGTDVLKALARGANAVLIGRSYLFGLGVAGSEGVTRVVNILRREFEMAMALTGRPTLKSIDRSVIWPGRS